MVSPLLPEGVILSATSGLMFCDWITQKIQFKDSFYFSLKKKKADEGENPTRVFMVNKRIVLRLSQKEARIDIPILPSAVTV